MTPEQRSRYRRLAEVELERGNVMAAVVLDCLDELDAIDRAAPLDALAAKIATNERRPAIVMGGSRDQFGIPAAVPNDPPTPPVTTPTVVPLHDLDYGPGGEIETDLGGEPSLEGRAPMRDAPPTTQS